ncbi:hypothetical protein BCR35DRAFT_327667 [Leucosporidium creatinivorum]|uniref:DUF1996 domain-containing protein n=1 Tax=Leucosporidium creatinivorum TaxID=106004 RepID=A0A1Y2G3M8_9BASI|nr:hypothetical protein BCR35DRAFT_327667 [Leucosporidium creatinivorum]
MALSRIDPIVNPGVVSSHVHAVVGGSSFAVDYTSAYKDAACTSISTPADRSNYWMPAVYGMKDNLFYALPVREVRIYYFLNTEMEAFPEGFKMLAGSPMTRSPDENMIWYCQQGSHDMTGVESLGRNSQFPLERCWDFLRSEITFPSCWSGDTTLDTEGQTAYRDGDSCPDTHPVQLPKIVLEFGYNSSDFDPTSLVLANGDTAGYGLHGDFASGWDRDVLQALIDDENCNARQNPYGEDDSTCKVLEGKRDDDGANSCTLVGPIPQEAVGIMEPLSALPGCNLLWSDNSTKPTCDPEPSTPAIGPYTAIFQSFGASYAGDVPGLIPVYEAGY